MKLFVQSSPAPMPDNLLVKAMSVALAAVFTLLAVAQLYSFEDFPAVVASFWLPGGVATDRLFAALLVTLEVLAIPYLLFMRLSPAMRIVSMVSGWIVVGAWLIIGFWINLTINEVVNSGVLGATIPTGPGWWMIALFTAFALALGWVSWQMTGQSTAMSSIQDNGQ